MVMCLASLKRCNSIPQKASKKKWMPGLTWAVISKDKKTTVTIKQSTNRTCKYMKHIQWPFLSLLPTILLILVVLIKFTSSYWLVLRCTYFILLYCSLDFPSKSLSSTGFKEVSMLKNIMLNYDPLTTSKLTIVTTFFKCKSKNSKK